MRDILFLQENGSFLPYDPSVVVFEVAAWVEAYCEGSVASELLDHDFLVCLSVLASKVRKVFDFVEGQRFLENGKAVVL